MEHPAELLLAPEACGTPDFPVLLPTAAATPADAAAADPGAPGGSANELVLGRPLPLISQCRAQGAGLWVLCFTLGSCPQPGGGGRKVVKGTHRGTLLPGPPLSALPEPVARHLETEPRKDSWEMEFRAAAAAQAGSTGQNYKLAAKLLHLNFGKIYK